MLQLPQQQWAVAPQVKLEFLARALRGASQHTCRVWHTQPVLLPSMLCKGQVKPYEDYGCAVGAPIVAAGCVGGSTAAGAGLGV